VRAFLEASRSGNFSALLALLDPGATLRGNAAVVAMGGAAYWQHDVQAGVKGADAVARAFSRRARAAQPVFIDGEPGAVWMHEGEVRVLFRFKITGDRSLRSISSPMTLRSRIRSSSVNPEIDPIAGRCRGPGRNLRDVGEGDSRWRRDP